MNEPTSATTEKDKTKEPKLRHEFVGMMFAVTIAEVGLQVAAVVQRGNWVHYLPAYSHLSLATIIVAASWVGWSLSPSAGARQDVRNVLHLGFLVLLTDVFLVVLYFILVRSVDFGAERHSPYIAPIPKVAFWIVFMFFVYLWWDFITKLPFLYNAKFDKTWFSIDGPRIVATLFCALVALWTKSLLGDPDRAHYIAADFALLGLILLFRALKDVCSFFFPRDALPAKELKLGKRRALIWATICILITVSGIAGARSEYSPSNSIVHRILIEPEPENRDSAATPSDKTENAEQQYSHSKGATEKQEPSKQQPSKKPGSVAKKSRD
jgi:hypothetical protein